MCIKMIAVVIFVVVTQSSASFYSEFTGALGSVKSKVGKLFTDVGHDLKETVDCATYAVEEVIYDKDQISNYYDKCKETTTESIPVGTPPPPPAINIIIKPAEPMILNNIKTEGATKSSDEMTDNSRKEIEQKLSNVQAVVNNEFYHVDNMTSHIVHEFLGLSKNVDKKLKVIEEEKADLQKTLLEIKLLHLQEEMEIEKSKDEIRKVFEEILKKINETTKEADLRNEMNAVMKDIQNNSSKVILDEIEKWKDRGVEQLNDMKKTEANKSQSTKELNINVPRTFQELAAKISRTSTANHLAQETTSSSIRPRSLSTTISLNSIEEVTFASPAPTVGTVASISETNIFSTESSTILITHTLNGSNTATSTMSTTLASTIIEDMSTYPITEALTSATISSTAKTPTPNKFTTLSLTNSITQSSTVVTSTVKSINTTAIVNATTPSTIEISTPNSSTQFSSITTTTSTEPLKEALIMVTEVSTLALPTIKEPDQQPSTVMTSELPLSTNPPPKITTSATSIKSSKDVLSDVTNTTEELATQYTTVISTTSEVPVTHVLTVSTTHPLTQVPPVTTDKPVTKVATTTSTTKPVSSYPILTKATIQPKKTSPKHKLGKKAKKKIKERSPAHIQVHQVSEAEPFAKPSDDIDDLIPKDPVAAVADALKIFGGSIKTKSVLDNFFKNLDAVPASKVL